MLFGGISKLSRGSFLESKTLTVICSPVAFRMRPVIWIVHPVNASKTKVRKAGILRIKQDFMAALLRELTDTLLCNHFIRSRSGFLINVFVGEGSFNHVRTTTGSMN